MPEEQIEQFKLESMNHLYQLVADIDEDFLVIFSEYVYNFYKWIEYSGEVKKAYDLKSGMGAFRERVSTDVVNQINNNSKKLLELYEKYSGGTTEKQEEKTSFESAYFPKSKNHFVLSKDDFPDIEEFKARTEDFKKREDESRAQANYNESYEDLCPEIATYNDIIERYGYDYIINMNKYILDKSKDAIDGMAEKLKNNKEPEEVYGILNELALGTRSYHFDKFDDELLFGVWKEIANHLSNYIWEIGEDSMPEEQIGEDSMPEEQLKQFRIESTNHLYQFLAYMDETLLIDFSWFISNFYGCIEESGIIEDEDDIEEWIEDFYSELSENMTRMIEINSRKLLRIYEKYSEGTTEKQEEKTSFDSAYFSESKNSIVLSKDDFLDIEKFKARTEDFKKREDESAAQSYYGKSYEDLCPEIATYNDIIGRYEYDYIINMNKCILDKSNDAIDRMTEKLKNNKKPDEVEGTLDDLVANILDAHDDEIGGLADGVRTDIGEHLSNSKQNKHV